MSMSIRHSGKPLLIAALVGSLVSGCAGMNDQQTTVAQGAGFGALLDVLLMAAGVFGLGALVGASPRVLDAITLAGAAVLVFYGVQALRRALAPGHLLAGPGAAGMPRARALREVLAISLLNPHVYLDTVVLVGAVGAGQPVALRPLFLAGAGLASALWFAALGYGARLLTPLFARPAAWRVLDSGVAVLMFTIAWGLLRGLRM